MSLYRLNDPFLRPSVTRKQDIKSKLYVNSVAGNLPVNDQKVAMLQPSSAINDIANQDVQRVKPITS